MGQREVLTVHVFFRPVMIYHRLEEITPLLTGVKSYSI